MVQFLGGEDPLEAGIATHSSILAWKNPHGQRSLGSMGVTKSWTRLSDKAQRSTFAVVLDSLGCNRNLKLSMAQNEFTIFLSSPFDSTTKGAVKLEMHVLINFTPGPVNSVQPVY